MGNGPIYHYQKFEYALGHWLQKSCEHVIGCVLCSPGCFSLMRCNALYEDANGEIDSAVAKYKSRPNEAIEYVQWNQGEDRWLCTLLMQKGWRIEFISISESFTNAPTELKDFFIQRRRWVPSSLFNTYDLIASWRKTTRISECISIWYILYQTLLTLSGLLSPITLIVIVYGSLQLLFGITWLSAVLAFLPPFIFICMNFYCKDDTLHIFVYIATLFYVLLMVAVFIVLIAGIIEPCGICNISNQFFLLLVIVYLLAGLLHPTEIMCLPAGIIYYVFMPTMFILLNIYAFMNLDNLSWGTREDKSGASGSSTESSNMAFCDCGISNCFHVKCCYMPKWWIEKNKKSVQQKSTTKIVVTEVAEKELTIG